VLSQFTPEAGSHWRCLADFITMPGVYAAGRLDADSEGLLLLTDQGRLQQRLTDPAFGHWRRYWVQVEGNPNTAALEQLGDGVLIQGQRTRPSRVRILSPGEIAAAAMAEREPPIRHRLRVPTCWLQLELREGRNRQVRRMTAAVGHPTLRLIRMAIDLMDSRPPLQLTGLAPGQWRPVSPDEERRLHQLLGRGRADGRPARRTSPGRGGRAGGGKSGRAGGGG
jgi:23S rRNA pseudouridine2457 synthase